MTKREAAVVTIFTGILIGNFSDAHEYAESLMGRPIFTHEFASEELAKELERLSRQDFIGIEVGK